MSLAETIYQHSLNLPESVAKEALDFIVFLEQRYGIKKKTDLASDTEAFLAAVTGGLSDDFPDDITDEDLGSDIPRQELN
ncbi:DUF2281 domain-containing protein [Methylomicrobium album]|uniref:DUF2281 domain-containing protein n=1 Tax=Methylomicrobium album BG8 TaxID=686340 RepID=H8GRL2_METAL|nr:DUF2281 domain-containing protein [Methylomicrobium album]EIC27854.1 Protein of unknown function (DUF2281) [Methylomicrobium album BG8]